MSDERKLPHGREKESEADDPMDLVMNPVPGGNSDLMATCLVEEYARLGMGEEEILALFKQPVYQTHGLYQQRGETWVRNLIQKVLARTGRMRVSVAILHHIGGCDG